MAYRVEDFTCKEDNMAQIKEETLTIDLMLCPKCEKVSDKEGTWRPFDPSNDKRDGYLIGLCPEYSDV